MTLSSKIAANSTQSIKSIFAIQTTYFPVSFNSARHFLLHPEFIFVLTDERVSGLSAFSMTHNVSSDFLFNIHFFPFFLCRCRQWVQNTCRVDLRNRTPLYLSTNCRLCSEHFELEQFSNKRTKNRLNWNAVPTIFKVPNAPKLLSTPHRPLDLH